MKPIPMLLEEGMMNHSTRVTRRPRRAWPPAVRTAAAVSATAAPVLLAVACSSSPSSTASSDTVAGTGGTPIAGGSMNSQLLTFSQCMRSHSVPNFPDPEPGTSNAKFPSAQQLGIGSSQYQAAYSACQHVLPAGTNDQFPAAEVQFLLGGMRQFSQCMRSHGQPNWPDPTVNSSGQPLFELSAHGITRSQAHSPQMMAVETECQHLLPSALGGTPIG